MRTLITGVAGFVGRHLAHELAKDPNEELNGADHLDLTDSEADGVLRCHLKSHLCLLELCARQVSHYTRGPG